MVLTNANSTNEPNINAVQTMNHISVALMYETFGNELPVFLDNVINVNIVLVPIWHIRLSFQRPKQNIYVYNNMIHLYSMMYHNLFLLKNIHFGTLLLL